MFRAQLQCIHEHLEATVFQLNRDGSLSLILIINKATCLHTSTLQLAIRVKADFF